MATNKIPCPECGVEIDLVPKESNPLRVAAFHACKGQRLRQVYETDAPSWPPPLLKDRIEPSENVSSKRHRRNKI